MTDIDDNVLDDDDLDGIFDDDDDFVVDLDAGLPDEGEYYAIIKSAEFRRNKEKDDSRGVNFVLEIDEQNYFDFVWFGNAKGANRGGNIKFASIVEAVTGETPSGKVDMRVYSPYKSEGKTFLGTFDNAPVKVTVAHRRHKDTKVLNPVFTYSSAE
jgi:hypothetical protein